MFMSEIASQVGARLRAYRQQSRLSQEALAELAGVAGNNREGLPRLAAADGEAV